MHASAYAWGMTFKSGDVYVRSSAIPVLWCALMGTFLGCATTGVTAEPPIEAAQTSPQVAAYEVRCPAFAFAEFVERRENGSIKTVRMDCARDGSAEVHVYESAATVDGEPDHEGYADTETIDREAAATAWRVLLERRWRGWTSCLDVAAGPRWNVHVDDGETSRLVHCHGGLPSGWRPVLEAVEQAGPDEEWDGEWQFNGEYWQDELGYYRVVK